ncbi:MAG: nucleotidyltransferase family protein [Reyranella sp.]|nr:nucleotidyltransferase family protein [Reyranella sp.]
MPDDRTDVVEFELLCLAARPKPDLTRVRDVLRQGVDYRHLIEISEYHGVRPSLFRCLSDVAWDTVPASARESLEAFQRRHLVRTLALSDELRRVAGLFADSGIPIVTFKGLALAMALYGGLANRECNDIDVIVPEGQIGEAERLLAQLGYRNAQGDEDFRRAFLVHQRQYAFARADGIGAIDLHWDFSGTHVPFPLAPADIWDDLAQISIGDHRVATVGGANLALLLAGHGTKEAWHALKWVCDFAWMIDRNPDLDWLDVHRRARLRRCGDSVLLGCSLVQRLLDVAVPHDLAGLVARSGRVRSLTASLVDHMRLGFLPTVSDENFTDLALCDGRLAQVKAALKLIFTPTAGDYEAMKLPAMLWSAYYVTRPFRLAVKALAALR